MANNRNTDNSAYLAALFAALITILLASIYFLVEANVKDASWKGFLQGISGNIIATTMSFLVVYIFIMRENVFGDSQDVYRRILNQIDLSINQLRDGILGKIENRSDLDSNSFFENKLELLKSDLISQMRQITEDIGNQVNTKLDFDSNELYSFYGLLGTKIGIVFQDFRVSRDSGSENTNAISSLWADTLYGNSVNAKVINSEHYSFLRVEFQSFESSWGCNVTVRPQDQRALDRRSLELNYLLFQARIPPEALQSPDLLQDVAIAILLVNGKYQHWDYGNRAGEYIQFPVKEDGSWTNVCTNLHDKTKWSHFTGDGNQHINQDEMNNADFSIISAVVIKIGKFRPGIRGELGYGKGVVDIKDMKFSSDPVKMS
jgi:hypothetical protein